MAAAIDWLTNLVGGLPAPVAVSVALLVTLLVVVLVVLPLVLLLVNEPRDAVAWIVTRHATIAGLRDERMTALGRALRAVVLVIDSVNRVVGQITAWISLVMVLTQFAVVIMRYVFAVGLIPMQESIWYMHGILFMLGAGYTLLRDGHVRVDILYREARPRRKALVDFLGIIFFLLPVCAYAWWLSFPYVANSWRIFEGSTETSGLPFIYLLKTVILAFLALLSIQGIALALRSLLVLLGLREEHETVPHEGL